MADFNIPSKDYAGKASGISLPVADAVLDAGLTALFNAVDGITTAALGQSSLDKAVIKDVGPGGNAASTDAQREAKWVVSYHDAVVTTDLYTMEIPCPDFSLRPSGSENMNLAAGGGLALKTALETNAKAPRTGNAIVVDEAILIARNL